jgi:hypothetical protein
MKRLFAKVKVPVSSVMPVAEINSNSMEYAIPVVKGLPI